MTAGDDEFLPFRLSTTSPLGCGPGASPQFRSGYRPEDRRLAGPHGGGPARHGERGFSWRGCHSRSPRAPEAMVLAIGAALAFGGIDMWYGLRVSIPPIYLADAVVQLAFLGALAWTRRTAYVAYAGAGGGARPAIP
jgi:hypothetical protein